MLAEYNNNPFDLKASKVTFQEVYERWSKEKFPTISHSNVKGYEASYKVCGSLNNKVFRDMKLVDLQTHTQKQKLSLHTKWLELSQT